MNKKFLLAVFTILLSHALEDKTNFVRIESAENAIIKDDQMEAHPLIAATANILKTKKCSIDLCFLIGFWID